MPPTGYLNTPGVESCLVYLASTYPSITQLIVLPEQSIEGRTSRAIKISGGSGEDRNGVLLIGGVHARELINPDLLVSLALKMCYAYTNNTGLTFGGKSWSASTIEMIVNALDIYIYPLVNPDGRTFVQQPGGNAWWRKNRRVNPGTSCMGIDLNRNYDFLWSSGIGTSSNPCSDTYKGAAAFSEPETRNVKWMLGTHSNIVCFADVHSYSQLILYPWGDDDNQTTDSSMNFQNPAWNGLRGVLGSGYAEYISPNDQNRHINTGNAIRDAISAVRGRVYTVEEGSDLYPTSGTSKDYSFARHFTSAGGPKVTAYTIETATEFQPPYSEALNVISEVSSGIIQFLLHCICVVREAARGTAVERRIADLHRFRDEELLKTRTGHHWVEMLDHHSAELAEIMVSDRDLVGRVGDVLEQMTKVIESRHSEQPERFPDEVIEAVGRFIEIGMERGSRHLRHDLEEIRRDLRLFAGKTVREGLEEAERSRLDQDNPHDE